MTDVFLSYAKEDRDRAKKLAEVLEAHGWTVFWDRKTLPGTNWKKHISGRLKEARCVVVLWSVASVESEWVDEEANVGKKRLVPVLLDDVEPPFGYQQIHAASLVDWDGGPDHDEFQQLFEAIAELVGEPQARAETRSEVAPPRSGRVEGARRGVLLTNEGVPDIDWIEIPGGPFLFGDGKRELTVPPFRIARFPITNAQYRAFVDDFGYTARRRNFWSAEGWKWKADRAGPDDGLTAVFLGPDHPRVYVRWFEAEAFCNWLGRKLEHEVSLPTEEQWEKAARGTDGREYPWGNEFDANRCNSVRSGINATTPVDRFPSGASPYDVMDMSGNVWEWTVSKEGASRVLRGGAFSYGEWFVRCAARYHYAPVDWYDLIGVRVCAPVL